MALCEVCGNEYDKVFKIIQGSESHVFDSFECAIHALAPVCEHCECRIIGHMFCCAHCAHHAGQHQLRDRADSRSTLAGPG